MPDAAKKRREWWIKPGVFPTGRVFWDEVWAAELERRQEAGEAPQPDDDPNKGW